MNRHAPSPAPLIALVLAASLVASCGKAAEEEVAEPEGFAVADGAPLVLALASQGPDAGSFVQADALLPGAAPQEPFAVARAATAVQPLGEGAAIVAVNRAGLALVRVTRAEATERLVVSKLGDGPLGSMDAEFAGRTAAQAWGSDGRAYFLLYRNPVFETAEPREPASVLLAADADGGAVWSTQPGAFDDAFAAFPVEEGSWLVQSRRYAGERVSPSYARLSTNGKPAQALNRATFEKEAGPVALAKAPEPLRAAAGAITGPLIVEARLADGSKRTYLRGDPAESAQGFAQVAGDGSAVLVMADGRYAVAKAGSDGRSAAEARALPLPVPDARYRDAAIVGGLLVAVWAEERFPNVGASGLVACKSGL